MKSLKLISYSVLLFLLGACTSEKQNILSEELAVNEEFNPETYVCYRTAGAINIDGKLDEADWEKAPWTKLFVDIEGDKKPAPLLATQAKMLWDDQYLYVAAKLDEPHIWSNVQKRDEVIFHDNDFEVFIDPDWDTHHYYEFEMNARNTVWDLMLTKPYRNGGMPINSWDIIGLKTAVYVDGTLNDASDTDKAWYVEIAFPWEVLHQAKPGDKLPVDGEQWRIDFSRVEWQTTIEDGKYIKKKDDKGNNIPEYNWVWSATGKINMHMPEAWGIVQFSESTTDAQNAVYKENEDWKTINQLRNLYYRQVNYKKEFGKYATTAKELRLSDFNPEITTNGDTYTASILSHSGTATWYIREDGRVWKEKR